MNFQDGSNEIVVDYCHEYEYLKYFTYAVI